MKTPQILNLNVGTGSGITVLELIKTFERVNNLKIPYSFVGRRKGDMENVVADNSKILEILITIFPLYIIQSY